MAYDLQDIRTRTLNKLDDDNFSASKVDQFINDTQREIFNTFDWHFSQASSTDTLQEDTRDLDFPTGAQRIRALEITAPDDYEKDLTRFFMDFNTFQKVYPDPVRATGNETEGVPSFWTVYGAKMYFAWFADRDYTIKIYYTKTPTTLVNDADVPEIPEEFGELLVTGAYIRALETNDDNDIADYQRTRYYQPQLQNMLIRFSPRVFGKQPVMRNSNRRGM